MDYYVYYNNLCHGALDRRRSFYLIFYDEQIMAIKTRSPGELY